MQLSVLKRPEIAILAAIVLIGAALRLFALSSVPVELIYDEVDLYNSVHSIVTTGHDVDGQLSVFTYSSTARNPPIYAIASYASSLVFGKNAFGLRFPAVVFGVLSILLIAGLAWRLTARKDVALIAAALMATQPIFIHFSRIAWEPAAELPFLLGGLYLLATALRRDRVSIISLGAGWILLALASYTYMAGWFYAITLGGSMLALNARALRTLRERAAALVAIAMWFVLCVPAFSVIFFDPHTASRNAAIGTFKDGVTLQTLGTFFHNYLAHFHWSYLIWNGDWIAGVTWRYMDGFGAFLWFVPLLALVGVPASLRIVRERPYAAWLFFWLLIYPLGGSLTNEGAPNAARTLAGAPVFCIYAAIGFAFLVDLAPRIRRRVYAASCGVALITLGFFSYNYFVIYPHNNSNAWDSGTGATFGQIRALGPDYQRLCLGIRSAWYSAASYVRFYLTDSRLQAIYSTDDPSCSLPGTIVAVDFDHPLKRKGFPIVGATQDVDGHPFAIIYAKQGPPASEQSLPR